MSLRRRYRELVCIGCAAIAAGAAILMKAPADLDGPALDYTVELRSIIYPADQCADSPVAVVTLDRRSLESPELRKYPRALLTPIWATLLRSLFAAHAKVVGFDVLFAYDAALLSGEFGIRSDYDAPFSRALAEYRERVVLARSAAMVPAARFWGAVGLDALGMAELPEDPDGRIRRVPASLAIVDGTIAPTIAALVLARSGGGTPAMPAEVLLAPRRALESIPTYSLVDVLRAASSNPGALEAAFEDKIVLVGGSLTEEDQLESSGRLIQPAHWRCPPSIVGGLARIAPAASVPEAAAGVFLDAAAIDAVATHHVVATAPRWLVAAAAAINALAGAAAGLMLAPWATVAAVGACAFALVAAAVVALEHDYWIPWALPMAALVMAPAVAYVARYLFEERARRQIERAFGRYLSPAIVDQLANDPRALRLGGERREVTVMFADLTGFTAASARLEPEVLTAALNRYLGYVVEAVEASGGYVDKFIGDAVMGVWAAPAPDPAHAANAVRAALHAAERIRLAAAEDRARGSVAFAIKIGVNSGPAIVGNVGAERRYNYTAVGETVNIAARLESIPAHYQCEIVVGPRTEELARGEFVFRELDWILVKGAKARMAIFEPIAERSHTTQAQSDRVAEYARALEAFRAKRFAEAASLWEQLATEETSVPYSDGDPQNRTSAAPAAGAPATVMALRARGLARHPPDSQWEAVNVFANK